MPRQLTLDPRWTGYLLKLPESGMGFQRVRVLLKDGRVLEHATVLNAQVLEVDESLRPFATADITAIELEPALRR
jgi:hypothetical protein